MMDRAEGEHRRGRPRKYASAEELKEATNRRRQEACQIQRLVQFKKQISFLRAELRKVRVDRDRQLKAVQIIKGKLEKAEEINKKINRDLDKSLIKATVLEKKWSFEEDKKKLNYLAKAFESMQILKQEHTQLCLEAHDWAADAAPDFNKMIVAVHALADAAAQYAQYNDLKLKYAEEISKSKCLFNLLQEAKGTVRVFCRCRPLNREEISSGYATVVDFPAAKDGKLGLITRGLTKKIFIFDKVYTLEDD